MHDVELCKNLRHLTRQKKKGREESARAPYHLEQGSLTEDNLHAAEQRSTLFPFPEKCGRVPSTSECVIARRETISSSSVGDNSLDSRPSQSSTIAITHILSKRGQEAARAKTPGG